ncbi:MAG TPA: response regulator [Phycisphaerales bacterium]|nr:response regulator [Phycisphaerales bacterium]
MTPSIAPQHAGLAGADPAGSGARLVVADDDALVVDGLARALGELGYRVVATAADGEAALAAGRAQRPDLAILDVRMPRFSGIEVARLLQAELGIPSLIVSAYADAGYIEQIRANGATCGVFGYLIKPVSLEDLRVGVAVALHQAALAGNRLDRIAQLEANLANRRVVEQAKWKMVQSLGLSEPEAHDRLQRLARDSRRPLVEVAREVVEAGSSPPARVRDAAPPA